MPDPSAYWLELSARWLSADLSPRYFTRVAFAFAASATLLNAAVARISRTRAALPPPLLPSPPQPTVEPLPCPEVVEPQPPPPAIATPERPPRVLVADASPMPVDGTRSSTPKSSVSTPLSKSSASRPSRRVAYVVGAPPPPSPKSGELCDRVRGCRGSPGAEGLTSDAWLETLSDERRQVESSWAEKLNAEQFRVLRMKGTEPIHSGRYNEHFEAGEYRCAGCDRPLYLASHKVRVRQQTPRAPPTAHRCRAATARDIEPPPRRRSPCAVQLGSRLAGVLRLVARRAHAPRHAQDRDLLRGLRWSHWPRVPLVALPTAKARAPLRQFGQPALRAGLRRAELTRGGTRVRSPVVCPVCPVCR
jgi:hypothetical protein